ncbi:MAG: hypothetical protein BJ554DRAFT_4092 [Olpidium bornovanus]|uniref:Uncharacterized protein n=1 Tax=Olpidium bornovanus TaxID=278681 RepID=A0A8H7ZML9_9FUNG|nr:MAG: hypothetical protein BJ554DRAFT_4092 [Olpidium bornovanus]
MVFLTGLSAGSRSFIQQASAARTPLIGSIIADPHEALTRFWKKWTNDKAPSTLTGTLRSYAWQCQEEQRRSDQADETGRQGGTGDEDDENAGGLSEFDRVRVNNDHKRNFDDCLVVNGYPFVPKTRKREPQPFQLHSKAPKSKRAWK